MGGGKEWGLGPPLHDSPRGWTPLGGVGPCWGQEWCPRAGYGRKDLLQVCVGDGRQQGPSGASGRAALLQVYLGKSRRGGASAPSVLAGHTLASRKPWLRLAAALHVLLTYVVKQTPWRSLPHLACKRRLAGRPALTCPQGPVGPHSKPFTGRRARGDCRMAEGGNSLAGSGILGSNDPTAFYSTGTGSLEKAGWDTLLGN